VQPPPDFSLDKITMFFGSSRSKIIVIDSHHSEQDFREKPITTFTHPDLVLRLPDLGAAG